MDEPVSSSSRHRPWENPKYNSTTTQSRSPALLADILDTTCNSEVVSHQNSHGDCIIGIIKHCITPKYGSLQSICR